MCHVVGGRALLLVQLSVTSRLWSVSVSAAQRAQSAFFFQRVSHHELIGEPRLL